MTDPHTQLYFLIGDPYFDTNGDVYIGSTQFGINEDNKVTHFENEKSSLGNISRIVKIYNMDNLTFENLTYTLFENHINHFISEQVLMHSEALDSRATDDDFRYLVNFINKSLASETPVPLVNTLPILGSEGSSSEKLVLRLKCEPFNQQVLNTVWGSREKAWKICMPDWMDIEIVGLTGIDPIKKSLIV